MALRADDPGGEGGAQDSVPPDPVFAGVLKEAQEATRIAAAELQKFIRRTEERWCYLATRNLVPRDRFDPIMVARDVDGMRMLFKEHMVEILRDYPEHDGSGRIIRRLRIFQGDKEVVRRTFAYQFNPEKKALEVEYS